MTTEMIDELIIKWRQRWSGLAGLQFSNWVLWKQRNSINVIDRVGVYVLAKYESGKVPSFADPLDERIVYIGKTNVGRTTSLKKRLTYFDREAFSTGASHSGASNYKKFFGDVQDDLYVSVCPVYWADEKINELFKNRNNYNDWISGNSPRAEPFILFLLVTWLEVCLRGIYVYKWSRLPKCNKE